MRRATWRHPAKPQQDAGGKWGQRPVEYLRAYCWRQCGGAVGHWWFDLNEHPQAFRLPRGVVYDREHRRWELSKRARKHRDRWIREGRPLDKWEPPPRHRLSLKAVNEQADIMDRALYGEEPPIPGVVAVLPGENDVPWFVVDPTPTSGAAVVRCPHCGCLNAVGSPA